jgi:putative endonuclease
MTQTEPNATPASEEEPHIDPRRAVGFQGEDLAAEYMRDKGWEVVARNYSLNAGEVDLIVSRVGVVGYRTEKTLVFVEVKTKQNRRGPPPEASVDYEKRRRLTRLARLFLQQEEIREVNVRFDVISVDLSDDEPRLTHFPCAFDAQGRIW